MSITLRLWQPSHAVQQGPNYRRPYVARVLGPSLKFGILRQFLTPVEREIGGQWVFELTEPGLYEIANKPGVKRTQQVKRAAVFHNEQLHWSSEELITEERPQSLLESTPDITILCRLEEVAAAHVVSTVPGYGAFVLFRGPDFDYWCAGLPEGGDARGWRTREWLKAATLSPPAYVPNEAQLAAWHCVPGPSLAEPQVKVVHAPVPRFQIGIVLKRTVDHVARRAVLATLTGPCWQRADIREHVARLIGRWRFRAYELGKEGGWFGEGHVSRAVRCRPAFAQTTPEAFGCGFRHICPFCYARMLQERWKRLVRVVSDPQLQRNKHRLLLWHYGVSDKIELPTQSDLWPQHLLELHHQQHEAELERFEKLRPEGAMTWATLLPDGSAYRLRVAEVLLFTRRRGVAAHVAALTRAAAWETKVVRAPKPKDLVRDFIRFSLYPRGYFAGDPAVCIALSHAMRRYRWNRTKGIFRIPRTEAQNGADRRPPEAVCEESELRELQGGQCEDRHAVDVPLASPTEPDFVI
jgi:hypothetical protein